MTLAAEGDGRRRLVPNTNPFPRVLTTTLSRRSVIRQ